MRCCTATYAQPTPHLRSQPNPGDFISAVSDIMRSSHKRATRRPKQTACENQGQEIVKKGHAARPAPSAGNLSLVLPLVTLCLSNVLQKFRPEYSRSYPSSKAGGSSEASRLSIGIDANLARRRPLSAICLSAVLVFGRAHHTKY